MFWTQEEEEEVGVVEEDITEGIVEAVVAEAAVEEVAEEEAAGTVTGFALIQGRLILSNVLNLFI